MRPRTRYSLIVVVALFGALAVAIVVRLKTPPYPTRLLPEADAIFYLDIAPIRSATHFDRDPTVRAPEFQHLVDVTGIVPERDLDSVALALHAMPNPNGPNGPVAFSAIFTLRYDPAKVSAYLASISTSQETYAGHTIYDVPSDGRTVRVALADDHSIATSNCPTTEQIHSILDHTRLGIGRTEGPSILAARYADVPWFSSAWAIGKLGMPFAESGRITALGLALPLAADTEFVASLRYTGKIHLRIEELAGSEPDARQSVQSLTSLLALVHTLEPIASRTPSQQAIHEIVNSIHIEQHKDRAVLTAEVAPSLLKQLAPAK